MAGLNKLLFSIVLLKLLLILQINGKPEKKDCDWVEWGKVVLIRDLSDCSKFYYCTRGKSPYHASCPSDSILSLYFNPNNSNCDFIPKAPEDCFPYTGPPISSTEEATTTEEITTTTKKPRPPVLDDSPDFVIDCKKKYCGLFPNTYGSCGTYVICVDGERLEKKCNDGQLFDVKTKECQPAVNATCWKEPNAGPHLRKKKQDECPYHGNPATTPISSTPTTAILQNPVVTDWGQWGSWQECPKGTYATGIYAWRRLLQQWQIDHAGITAVSFICQTPGGNETDKTIESLAPNLPRDGWPFYYMCKGAVVGFQLNSVDKNGLRGDQVATDNVQGMCSCSAPVRKPYELAMYAPQNGNRGVWTTAQYCKKGQAVCGMQTQMHEYKEYLIGKYDNTGMNNMRVKCCDVPNPLETCTPKEERLLVRTCDNSKSDEGLRCDFDSVVGYAIDYDTNEKLVDFFSSVGYSYAESKSEMSSKIEDALKKQIENGKRLEYTWNDIPPVVQTYQKVTSKTLYPKAYENVELYQIVGRCSYFLVRTNMYVKVIKDGRTGSIVKQQKFEV